MIGRGGILIVFSISCGVECRVLGRTASYDVFCFFVFYPTRILSKNLPDLAMILAFEKTQAQKCLCHKPMLQTRRQEKRRCFQYYKTKERGLGHVLFAAPGFKLVRVPGVSGGSERLLGASRPTVC